MVGDEALTGEVLWRILVSSLFSSRAEAVTGDFLSIEDDVAIGIRPGGGDRGVGSGAKGAFGEIERQLSGF